MTYPEAIEYIFSQLPMFHRVGAAAYKADLERTKQLDEILGHPHTAYKAVHVAGTNGKGSVSNFLASVFQQAGYKTGLFTSPHLKSFRERIRVNGEMIPEADVADFITRFRPVFEKISPSFFEMTFALASEYFARQKADIVVWETGMGGRLDSTNVINPFISVITNVGYDHMQFLGNTLEKIAEEKAGIIKNRVPVVVGETHTETERVFRKKAFEMNSPLYFADNEFLLDISRWLPYHQGFEFAVVKNNSIYFENGFSPFGGNYQRKNLCTVFKVIDLLREEFILSDSVIRQGIANVKANTGFCGRWQLLQKNPVVICDTAHNTDGIKEVISQLEKMPYKSLRMVIGMVSDKDIDSVLALFPSMATYYFCSPSVPRGLPAIDLQKIAGKHGLKGDVYLSVAEAFKAALEHAHAEDLVFVGGSTFVVAEVV